MNWKDLPDGDEKRNRYYCSREWAEKKEAVRKRSKGICERCGSNKAENVHHATYLRLYAERLGDLEHLCRGCHEYISGKSKFDPRKQAVKRAAKTTKPVLVAEARARARVLKSLERKELSPADEIRVLEDLVTAERKRQGIEVAP